MMRYPIFVYGTLKRGKPNYAHLLAGHTIAERPARLARAALYDFGPYPFLTTEDDLVGPDDLVLGQLITLRPADYDAAMASLDNLEGYIPGGSNNLYERVVLDVETTEGHRPAFVYVAGPQMLAEIRAGTLPKVAGGNW